MKKILLIIGGIVVLLILVSLIAVATNPEAKRSSEKGQNEAKQMVEGQPAVSPLQVDQQAVKENNKKALNGEIVEISTCRDAYYELMGSSMQTVVQLGEVQIPQGLLLVKAWSDYLQKRPTVSNAGYFHYPDTDGNCVVGFSVNFEGGMRNVYTYKQEGNNFVAKNAPAMKLTPWFVAEQSKEDLGLTAKELEIYDYGVNLNNEYMSQYNVATAEQKALTDTAKKFGISEAEIIEIMDKAIRNLIKSQ